MYVVSLATKSIRRITRLNQNKSAASWLNSDELLITLEPNKNDQKAVTDPLVKFELSENKAIRQTTLSVNTTDDRSVPHSIVAVSPSGQDIIYRSNSDGKDTLYKMDIQSGESEWISNTFAFTEDINWSPDGHYLIWSGYEKPAWVDAPHNIRSVQAFDLVSKAVFTISRVNEFASNPTISPNSTEIAYIVTKFPIDEGPSSQQITVVNWPSLVHREIGKSVQLMHPNIVGWVTHSWVFEEPQ